MIDKRKFSALRDESFIPGFIFMLSFEFVNKKIFQ